MGMIDVPLDALLDKHQAARLLGLSAGTVASATWRRRTGLRAIRLGGMLRFQPQDVAALLERGREMFDQARSRQEMQTNANEGACYESLTVRPPIR